MSRTWLVNCRAIAKKVRNAGQSSDQQIKDCGANRECPNCHHHIDNSDVSNEWPGLPAGVKFDPSDVELLEHLAAKSCVGNSKPHMFIDEFIPTLEVEQGICYSHPKNLPGAKKDGSSVHFFHKTSNAYATGQRKRRKIQCQQSLNEEHVRWHKTGKTKHVKENGVQKGCKKIMVLYKSSMKGSKPDKSNKSKWVMHQYHLGTEEDEKEGEYVVSKIFYQQEKQPEKSDNCPPIIENPNNLTPRTSPRTPNTNPPNPPRPGKSVKQDGVADDNTLESSVQEPVDIAESFLVPAPGVQFDDNLDYSTWFAGESQAIENSDLDSIEDSLLCKEEINSSAAFNNSGINNTRENNSAPCGISDLENLEFDTPPDFHLSDYPFGSQEGILDWNITLLKDGLPKLVSTYVIQKGTPFCDDSRSSFEPLDHPFSGWSRSMSTSRGRSMRSKVERRMQKESGKTLREIRRAKKIKKKLMTDEERLIYNLKRAKKKVALLLQKLKKYELPDLPPPVHDPELFTPEQLQAYKKIGFRNKNYVPVGVRGVFGGVVQNMHLHWKFHETVQVCCDNFPKEKIKEMATMLSRLSGGIAINVHNVKTIIMFRGRNYRQPKNLIPFNTLTKRKALFKARFEQALESQKLNIKKIEQQLRRTGVNPEDPVAMASIQRVASTFFNAIDQKEGSPYVFRGDKESIFEPNRSIEQSEPPDDSDQEELDNFIAEIEDAADKEWEAEEAAEKEEFIRIRYRNREESGGRFRRSGNYSDDDQDDNIRARGWKDKHSQKRSADNGDEVDDEWESSHAANASNLESDADDSDEAHDEFNRFKVERGKQNNIGRANINNKGFQRNAEANINRKMAIEDSEPENNFSDLENAMWQSDSEEEPDSRAVASHDHRKRNCKNGVNDFGSNADDSDEADDDIHRRQNEKPNTRQNNIDANFRRNANANFRGKMAEKDSRSEDLFSDSEVTMYESDEEKDSGSLGYNYISSDEESNHPEKYDKNEVNQRTTKKTRKEVDETWDSD
ncbi:hypothetical protein EZV62_019989 [Acer yangbiense]|uniref:NAC domain-containing protein n=1 Tax=Acer yangbiense TaxID=1000413 RepID=A0A5C7HC89_9ROSI|nr:hypothetical protein EZV62_019989 [Acer yangbiense]